MATVRYSPTAAEVRGAVARLTKVIASTRRCFKIGRVGASSFPGLPYAERYADLYDDGPHLLFLGSVGKVAYMEEHLIDYALTKHEHRCDNQQVGGGGQSLDENHVVYVFTRPPNRTIAALVDPGPLYGALKKAWIGFKICKSDGNDVGMRLYARIINKIQRQLGERVTDFDI